MKLQNAKRERYPTDLTDTEWEMIRRLLPPLEHGGRPQETSRREVLNAVFYLLRSGCDWRMLPHDFPKWQLVYHYFREWKRDGTWQGLHDVLRNRVRRQAGKKRQPTAGIIDSQSVKTTEKGGFVALTLRKT